MRAQVELTLDDDTEYRVEVEVTREDAALNGDARPEARRLVEAAFAAVRQAAELDTQDVYPTHDQVAVALAGVASDMKDDEPLPRGRFARQGADAVIALFPKRPGS